MKIIKHFDMASRSNIIVAQHIEPIRSSAESISTEIRLLTAMNHLV